MSLMTIGCRSVARKVGRPKVSERNDRVARIDSTLLGMAEMVARARGITIAEYLSDTLDGPIKRDFAEQMAKLQAESKGNK